MEVHANAPLGLKSGVCWCERVVEEGWSLTQAAAAAEVSDRCASQVGGPLSR